MDRMTARCAGALRRAAWWALACASLAALTAEPDDGFVLSTGLLAFALGRMAGATLRHG